jgi:hypothetical protein
MRLLIRTPTVFTDSRRDLDVPQAENQNKGMLLPSTNKKPRPEMVGVVF